MEKNFKHNFYNKTFPEVDDLVSVRVNTIDDMSAYVSLLEYSDREANILLSDLSRRKLRSNKMLRKNKFEVLRVLRVDTKKGYIDLTKKNLLEDDINLQTDRYSKTKLVHTIISNISKDEVDLAFLYRTVVWPLADLYGDCHTAFAKISFDEKMNIENNLCRQSILDCNPFEDFPQKEDLLKGIRHHFPVEKTLLVKEVQVTCFGTEGIDGIKYALNEGKKVHTGIGIYLQKSPLYIIEYETYDVPEGEKILSNAINRIREAIRPLKGDCIMHVKKDKLLKQARDEEY